VSRYQSDDVDETTKVIRGFLEELDIEIKESQMKVLDRVKQFVDNLSASVKRMKKLNCIPSDQLANLLMSEIYADIEIFTDKSDIVEECIDRLKKLHKWETTDCGYECGYVEPYGFVPEADCPVHDKEWM